jgi:hypothetical protein
MSPTFKLDTSNLYFGEVTLWQSGVPLWVFKPKDSCPLCIDLCDKSASKLVAWGMVDVENNVAYF